MYGNKIILIKTYKTGKAILCMSTLLFKSWKILRLSRFSVSDMGWCLCIGMRETERERERKRNIRMGGRKRITTSISYLLMTWFGMIFILMFITMWTTTKLCRRNSIGSVARETKDSTKGRIDWEEPLWSEEWVITHMLKSICPDHTCAIRCTPY